VLNRQIQKEIWRIQDVMEGLRKNNPSRGTDTAKHRGGQEPSAFMASIRYLPNHTILRARQGLFRLQNLLWILGGRQGSFIPHRVVQIDH
jgi:hypothetical protein